MKINNIDPIICTSDKSFADFIKLGLDCFYRELEGYITHNNDPVVLEYGYEGTLMALFINGMVRRNGHAYTITALQEYGTYKKSNGGNGRLDAFIRYKDTGIWIEAKYDKAGAIKDRDSHWDIEKWLWWDEIEILSQVEDYYSGEYSTVNNTYGFHYIMTLAFKKISEEKVNFINEACKELGQNIHNLYNRSWYYSVGFLEKKDSKDCGLEIYGSFKKKFEKD